MIVHSYVKLPEGRFRCHSFRTRLFIRIFSTGEVRTQPKLQDDLVGGLNPSEKYEFVSWEYYSQLNGKS